MADFGLGTDDTKLSKKIVAALEELFTLTQMKKQVTLMPFSLLLLPLKQLLCHFLKIGVKLLIAKMTYLGRKLEISSRQADTGRHLYVSELFTSIRG